MKLGLAGFMHETNTFSPGKTDWTHFQNHCINKPDEFFKLYKGTRTEIGGVIEVSKVENFEVIPIFFAQATPSAIVTEETKEYLIEELCARVEREFTSLDGLILVLHGAMASEKCEDVEGELLVRLRNIVGKRFPISVTIDSHANVSEEMVDLSNIILAYNTYPHIDAYERGFEASILLIKYINGQLEPVTVLKSSNLLIALLK